MISGGTPRKSARAFASLILLIAVVATTTSLQAQQSVPCKLGPQRTVTICKPVAGVMYDSPIRVLAGTLHSQPILAMHVYLDNIKVYETKTDVVDTNLIISSGVHRLTVQAFDASGAYKTNLSLQIRTRSFGQFAYVTNSRDGTISGFALDSTGFLRQNGYTFNNAHPSGVADTWRGFVYIASGTGGYIRGYKRDSTGHLKEVPGSPFACGSDCRALATDKGARYLYATDYANEQLYGFSINSTTGELSRVSGSPFSVGGKPNAIVVSVRDIVFVSLEGIGITSFRMDENTGELFEVRELIGTAQASLAVDPFGYFLYSADRSAGLIYGYTITSTGDLNLMNTPWFSSLGSEPSSIAVYPSGAFLYVANKNSNTIVVFKIEKNGLLRFTSVANVGNQPTALRVDPEGRYLFAVTSGVPYEVWQYRIDLTSGALKMLRRTRTRDSGSAIAVSSGRAPLATTSGYVYVSAANLEQRSGKVWGFAIGPGGALLPVPGSPFANPDTPLSLAVHPSGRVLYAPGPLNQSYDSTVAQYDVNPSNGTLVPAATYVTPSIVAQNLVIEPSGRFAYSANSCCIGGAEPSWEGFSLSQAGYLGNWLWYGEDDYEGDRVILDPTGKFAYLPPSLRSSKIDAETGVISRNFVEPTFSVTKSVADPTGRFVFGMATDITSYAANGKSGGVSLVGSVPSGGASPSDIVVDPYGRFVFVSDRNLNIVTIYKINRGTGKLIALESQSAKTGAAPVAMVVDTTGKYLYVANEQSRNVSGFAISDSGELKPIPGSPFATASTGILNSIVTIGAVGSTQ